MFGKYFEQIIPGTKWLEIQREAHEVASARALYSIRHNCDPLATHDKNIARKTAPEESKLPYVYEKTVASIKNGLYGEIIARDLSKEGLDVNGMNPLDSIPGLEDHLKGLRLSNLGQVAHPINMGNLTRTQKLDIMNCDLYCPWDNRKIKFYTRIIDESHKEVFGADEKPKDLYEEPRFFVDYEHEARRPTELWLTAIDMRQIIDDDTCEGDLVFVKHFFLDYMQFILEEMIEERAEQLKESGLSLQFMSLMGCTPYKYCTPANVQSRKQVKDWIKLQDDLADDNVITHRKKRQGKEYGETP